MNADAREVEAFREALEAIEHTEEELDRVRRARNNAAARLAGKLSLAELAEISGVSRERVRQWAKEGEA